MRRQSQSAATVTPRVWVLLNHRAGENNQILALAEALGWPFEIKRFTYRRGVPYLLLGASLAAIDRLRSDPLTPPWPDLIISASARNEAICRWIQREAARDGHRVRLVHIGRPFNRLNRFDLVITTPQYRLPRRPNVLHNTTTLHRVMPQRLAGEAARWQDRFAHLPGPKVAVLIGGSSGPYVMNAVAARALARQAQALAAGKGGSLLVTTSARTRRGVLEAFLENVEVPVCAYQWRRDDPDNPYFAYLALADEIVVTCDSLSMLTEACATGKPVHLFDLEAVRRSPWDWHPERLRAALYRWAMDWLPKRLTRDLSLVHRQLAVEGRVVWLGETARPVTPLNPPSLTDIERATRRVRALFREQPRIQPLLNAAFS
ncbi:conserved hypothetical protein [Methylomarinovum caldicuralii]|uniref:Nucleoside-diphosphate sugar epimerase n=1 Tax=Methylomarinovum caldicuralii TaxID=438856 RepID=A0AAU9BTW1_9GAMM|nr:conserved hypothetical protein [Methylomarinovum caldicuralii]